MPIPIDIQGDRARFTTGPLDKAGRTELLHALEAALESGAKRVVVDLSSVERASTLAASTILEALEAAAARGAELSLEAAPDELLDLLRIFRLDRVLAKPPRTGPAEGALARLGGAFLEGLAYARELAYLAQVAIYWGVIGPVRGRGLKLASLIHEAHKSGATAWPIVATIGALMGAVLAINAAYQLKLFGAYIYVADLVGVAVTRELGPVITAVLVAGRSGSTIAAEIGTMKVTEEIDALRTMGLNPGKFLVAPKVLGLMATLPGLVAIACAVAIGAGLLVGVFLLDLSARHYIDRTLIAVHASDVLLGLIKSVVFAGLIGVIACHEGFRVRGGAEEVGHATTAAVVRGILLVIVANAVFTAAFYGVRS